MIPDAYFIDVAREETSGGRRCSLIVGSADSERQDAVIVRRVCGSERAFKNSIQVNPE